MVSLHFTSSSKESIEIVAACNRQFKEPQTMSSSVLTSGGTRCWFQLGFPFFALHWKLFVIAIEMQAQLVTLQKATMTLNGYKIPEHYYRIRCLQNSL